MEFGSRERLQHVISYHMYATLRGHSAAVRALDFNRAECMLVSGDDTGTIVIWNLATRRPLHTWPAHANTILTVRFLSDSRLLTHGRDNKLRIWNTCDAPKVEYEQDVNAMSFCSVATDGTRFPLLLAVPATTESSKIDVYSISESMQLSRLFKALAPPAAPESGESGGNGGNGASTFEEIPTELDALEASLNMKGDGSVMALQFMSDTLVAGFESGRVVAFQQGAPPVCAKAHKSAILSLVSDGTEVYTGGADKRLARTDVRTGATHSITKLPGRAGSLALDDELRVAACWDQKLRVFSKDWDLAASYDVPDVTVCGVSVIEAPKMLRPLPRRVVAAGTKDGRVVLFDGAATPALPPSRSAHSGPSDRTRLAGIN